MPALSPIQNTPRSPQQTYADTVRYITRAIKDGLYTPRFQDANSLIAARKGEEEPEAIGAGEGKTEIERQCMRGMHVLRNALLRGTYDPKQDEGFTRLITTINRRLDEELARNREATQRRPH